MVWIMDLPDDILPDTCIINYKNGEWCGMTNECVNIFYDQITILT